MSTSYTTGTKVVLNVANVSNLDIRKYDGLTAMVDFQCATIEGVPGLVYVNFVPKGKRKEISIALHTSSLTAV